jgi:uncharacterized protein (DUF1800 family)
MHTNYRWALVAATVSGILSLHPASGLPVNSTAHAIHLSAVRGVLLMTEAASGPTSVTVSGPTTVDVGTPVQYKVAVAGSDDTSMIWEVNGVSGGSASYGTISTLGLYTPPPSVPAANQIVIKAISRDNGVSGSLDATILYPTPQLTSATGSTADGGQTFTVNVYGLNFMTGATILIAGSPVATATDGQDDLETTVSNPGGAASKITLTVQNPSPGVTLSNAVTITLTPTLASPTAAGRLLDQMTFGPTAAALAHVEQIGLAAAVAEQFNEPTTLYSQPPFPDAECPPLLTNERCTQSEFLSVSAWGSDQLRQRVAMALSELWVAPISEHNAMPFYLNTLAKDAFTNYRTIMHDATLAPTMGSYLNMANSAKALPGEIANENFGREIMQLFTMGLSLLNPDGSVQTDAAGNPIPAYTELQVEAFARAYTGWTYANADGTTPATFNWQQNWQHLMVPVESQHDTTAKILLNGTTLAAGQTANEDLTAALDNIFAHPNVGPFVCRQLIQHLVEGDPSPAYVQRVAAVFANNGSDVRGDMKAVLTAILLDPEARAGDAQTADQADSAPEIDGGHLREPLLWTVNVIRALGAAKANPADPYPFGSLMGGQMGMIGEQAFGQASVFNFFSPQYLVPQTTMNSPEFEIENTGTIDPRLNVGYAIVYNNVPGLTVDLTPSSAIGQLAGDPAELADYLGMLFLHSQMPSAMRSNLIAAIAAIPASELQTRAEEAVYLVVTSSEYKIIH